MLLNGDNIFREVGFYMKKIISLLLTAIILLNLSACSSNKKNKNETETVPEEVKEVTENKPDKSSKDPIVKIEELPLEVKILEPDSIGTRYMEATYKNDSKYPIKGLSITVLLNDKNEKTYLAVYDSVLPGETSPKFETFAPETGKSEDYEFLTYEITVAKDEYNTVHIIYDVKTQEYNWF